MAWVKIGKNFYTFKKVYISILHLSIQLQQMSWTRAILGGYLGAKAAGKKRERRKEELTDDGERRVVLDPNEMDAFPTEFGTDGRLIFTVESIDETPINVIVVNERNLGYIQAGKAEFATPFESGMTTREKVDIRLPKGNWYVVQYNESQREQAIIYNQWRIDGT